MELHTWGDSAPCKGHKLTKPPIPSIGNFPSHCYQQFPRDTPNNKGYCHCP